jgi:hypothetical protein
MTRELRAVVEPSAMERLRSGSIVGPIWWEADGEGFPEIGWDDFPVVILGWWLSALRSGRPGRSPTTVELVFMDGPWEASLSLRGDECRAELRRSYPKVIDWSGAISFDVLRDSVEAAGSEVIAECDRKGWTSSDIDLLRSSITKWP